MPGRIGTGPINAPSGTRPSCGSDAPAGARYARFRAAGSLKRSEFGMVKFVDLVGDAVDFSIRTDAWR